MQHVQSNIQREYPGAETSRGCAFAEPELLTFRKPKHVIQNKNNGHKNPNNGHNYHDEKLYQRIREHIMPLNTRTTHTQKNI